MEKSCDSFWKWGRARKKTSFTKGSCLEGGFCSMSDKASSLADGFPLKIPRNGGPLKVKHCMDVASIPRSHKIAEVNPSKFGRACSGLVLQIESSNGEVNFCDSKYKKIEANGMNSPTSVVQPSASDADTLSCNPRDHLRCSSDVKLFEGGNLCEREESSKLRARRMGQKASYDDGVRNRCSKGTSFLEDTLHCWISEDEDGGMQLQQWSIDEETRDLKPVGVSEATSNYMDESCKKPKPCHSQISNRGHEIHKENSEAFAAINILADVALRAVENSYEGEDKSKVSWGHCKISGAPSSQKNVMERNKSDSHFLPHQFPVHANKLFPLFTSKMGSPECNLKRELDQDICQGLDDKKANGGENLNVRSSKRSRSQYLNCKYPDSVLEPLKKCIRR